MSEEADKKTEAEIAEAAKAIPTVEIDIGGKKRTLACSMYVLWKYQQETGKNPFDLKMKEMNPLDMVEFLYAAMCQDEPDISKEAVAKMMTAHHLSNLAELIRKLFSISAPSRDKDDDSAPETTDPKKN